MRKQKRQRILEASSSTNTSTSSSDLGETLQSKKGNSLVPLREIQNEPERITGETGFLDLCDTSTSNPTTTRSSNLEANRNNAEVACQVEDNDAITALVLEEKE